MAIRPDILNADANMLVHELGDDACRRPTSRQLSDYSTLVQALS
jgi:hypothetical protein